MYNSNGDLVPIEINTNVGMDSITLEDTKNIINLSGLTEFILSNNFTKITYIGILNYYHLNFEALAQKYNIDYEHFIIGGGGKNIPYLEDTSDHLIIRSAYDPTALVDDEYCSQKINFLNLIKNSSFGHQYAYIDDDGILVNNITTITDNGNHPNFILKANSPSYDINIYPKMYKVSNQSELNTILQDVKDGYFLMQFYYNPNKLYENHVRSIRSFNLLVPPNLNSISLGQHTKLTNRCVDEFSVFDENTFELKSDDRSKYISADGGLYRPKLIDTDHVEMIDGSFKSALDLQIGDVVKTVIVPNPNNVDLNDPLADFGITIDEFKSGATYSSNEILAKARVDKLVNYVTITFTDGTTWEDTINSTYLSLRYSGDTNDVRYLYLDNRNEYGLQDGDKVILVNSTTFGLDVELKTMKKIEVTKVIFGGWEITVADQHNFLTKSENSTSSFVAIEHNGTCTIPCYDAGFCGKRAVCCPTDIYCSYGLVCQPNSSTCAYWSCCKA